jgi:hypothetical protein
MSVPDMTSAGKKCATEGLIKESLGLQCYKNIGFTDPCAMIWNFDGIYDGRVCAEICIPELHAPDNGPPPTCPLNDCLQCDEDKAGPIFKDFAGRTRRRSGIEDDIVRSCDEFAHIINLPCPQTPNSTNWDSDSGTLE